MKMLVQRGLVAVLLVIVVGRVSGVRPPTATGGVPAVTPGYHEARGPACTASGVRVAESGRSFRWACPSELQLMLETVRPIGIVTRWIGLPSRRFVEGSDAVRPSTGPTGSGDPTPQPGDRLLFDTRTSLQKANTDAEARALFSSIAFEPAGVYGWSLATNFDGSGRNAMRGSIKGVGLDCGDSGDGALVVDVPAPLPARELYVQWRMYLGRHPKDVGAFVGRVNFYSVKNPACRVTGRKLVIMPRVNDGGEGSGGRLDHDWSSSGRTNPRITFQSLRPSFLIGLSRWSADLHSAQELVYTVYYRLSSGPGVADGVARVWVNGILEGERWGLVLGTSPIRRIRLSSTQSDPAEDMTEYMWDIVYWEPRR